MLLAQILPTVALSFKVVHSLPVTTNNAIPSLDNATFSLEQPDPDNASCVPDRSSRFAPITWDICAPAFALLDADIAARPGKIVFGGAHGLQSQSWSDPAQGPVMCEIIMSDNGGPAEEFRVTYGYIRLRALMILNYCDVRAGGPGRGGTTGKKGVGGDWSIFVLGTNVVEEEAGVREIDTS